MPREEVIVNKLQVKTQNDCFELAEKYFLKLTNLGIYFKIVNGYNPTKRQIGRDIDLFINKKDIKVIVHIFHETATEFDWNFQYGRENNNWFPKGIFQIVAVKKTEIGYKYVAIDLIFREFVFAVNAQFPLHLNTKIDDEELIFFKNYFIKAIAGITPKFFPNISIPLIKKSAYFKKHILINDLDLILDCLKNNQTPVEWKKLRKNIQYRFFWLHPILSLKNSIYSLIRKLISPYLNAIPKIVFLGPDGVGKSTLISKLTEELNDTFLVVKSFHWRPQIIPNMEFIFKSKIKSPSTSTSVAPRRKSGKLGTFRFLYYYLDYILGLLITDRHSTFSEVPIIFYDRYLYDFYVDPFRFGIKKINWLFGMIKYFPKPDLVILLKDKPENIVKRKNELSLKEIQIQYENFNFLSKHNLIDIIVEFDKTEYNKIISDLASQILMLVQQKYPMEVK